MSAVAPPLTRPPVLRRPPLQTRRRCSASITAAGAGTLLGAARAQPMRSRPANCSPRCGMCCAARGGESPESLVFFNIRLPRLILGVAAGAGLGMAGALMQGLSRNPLADPGLIGISSGAALAAGITIVLGAAWFPDLPRALGSWSLVLMALTGGLGVTVLVYLLAQADGGTRVGLDVVGRHGGQRAGGGLGWGF